MTSEEHNFSLTIPLNSWTYVTFVADGEKITAFLNDANISEPISLSLPLPCEVIGAKGETASFFSGELDNLTFTHKTYNKTQIEALFHGIFKGGNGTKTSPYFIATPYQLNSIRIFPDKYYKQVNSISLENFANWSGIANFSGGYDGSNFEITDLKITELLDDSISTGLFGSTDNAELQHICLDGTIDISDTFTGEDLYAGLLAGSAVNTSITNCTVSGSITIPKTEKGYDDGDAGGLCVGGLVGLYESSGNDVPLLSQCGSSVTIDKGANRAGGLIGVLNVSNAFIFSQCYSKGKTTAMNGEDIYDVAGGLVGVINMKANDAKVTLENSYNLSTVTGLLAGGLIGSYYYGSSSNTNTSLHVNNCFSAGGVTSSAKLDDSLLANFSGSENIVWNKIFIDKTAVITSNHFNDDEITVVDDQVKMFKEETYTGWDFSTIWKSNESNDSYPSLKWEE